MLASPDAAANLDSPETPDFAVRKETRVCQDAKDPTERRESED